MPRPIIITPTGGPFGTVSGSATHSSASVVSTSPIQVCGLVALADCAFEECRTYQGSCYINPVFGTIGVSKSTYENDFSSFYIDDTFYRTVKYYLQKLDTILQRWSDVATISDTALYGRYYPQGSFLDHLSRHGYKLNWGSVLTLQGSGIYRIRVATYDTDPLKPTSFPYCLISETFNLLPFSCRLARGTAKFEMQITGEIGSIDTDGYVFDLCGMTILDSIRMPGFFGKETSTYDSVELEYQTGLIDPVRDEVLQHFKWESKMLPKYIHDRFKTYALMSDVLVVSDYNWNNADYTLKQKRVVKAGAYEPVFRPGTRLSNVTVDFKEGIQGVIKTLSCDPKQ